jgi:hypothetical protein
MSAETRAMAAETRAMSAEKRLTARETARDESIMKLTLRRSVINIMLLPYLNDRKKKKLVSSPDAFFRDSRIWPIRALGRFYMR